MDFQKNDIIVVEIEDIGNDGEGIGKVDGFTLFVKDAIVGDTVEARIVKSKKNYAYARLEKVIKPSPFRVEARCAYHRQCGGCQLQALSYEKQLEFKQKKIRDSLVRIGGFAPEYVDGRMEPIAGMEEPFRYRNKAQYPVGKDKNGRLITGFYAGRTHSIIANTDCLLGAEENEEILNCILEYMGENRVSTYDETDGTGLVRHVLIRKGFASGQIMVCLVINKKMTCLSCEAGHRKERGQRKEQEKDKERGRDKEQRQENDQRQGKEQRQEKIQRQGEEQGQEKIQRQGEEQRQEQIQRQGEKQRQEQEEEKGKEQRQGKERSHAKEQVQGKEQRQGQEERLGQERQQGKERGHGEVPERQHKTEYLPRQEELVRRLIRIKGMTSVSVSINTEKTNVIMGTEIHTLWGSDTISDTIHVRDMAQPGYPFTGEGLTFCISPLSFYQVNPGQTEKLYSLALEYAGLSGKETVWDLYCGIGTISLLLAGSARKVYGVEIVPQAIADARENAVRNGIGNAEFFVGKAEEVLGEFYEGNEAEEKPDVIVVDPPRKGCDGACLEAMLKMQPERIVYVSCDPATLARDLRVLCDGGYEVERIRGVDQFGMTVHVETVCLLSNRKPDTKVRIDVDLEDYYRIKDAKKTQN